MKNIVVCMSDDGFAAFAEMLDRPAKAVPEMVELMRRPAPWESEAVTDDPDSPS